MQAMKTPATSVVGVFFIPAFHRQIANPYMPMLLPTSDQPASTVFRVLLVTFNWSTLTEMPYLLKQAGCQVEVLCPSSNLAIKNSFFDRWIDAGDSMESLLASLVELARDPGYRYIMIGDDPILWAIYRGPIPALWHLLPVQNAAALPILHKIGFAEHCQQHAIPSPAFARAESRADALQALHTLGLPLVFKENYSNGGNGVKVFTDAPSCQAFIDSYSFSQPLLAQRFIEGRHVDVEALFKNGCLLQYVCSEVLEDNYGPSSKRRYFPNDERIGHTIARMGQTAGLHGFANMSLMLEADSQTYYLFEADPRPNKWVPYARWFGRDFAPAFRAFLADGPSADVACLATTDSHVDCWEVEHFSSHLAKLLGAGRYLDAILHLLDFDKNLRYTVYDPVLLKAKMDDLYRQLLPQRDALAAKAARHVAALQNPAATIPVNQPPEHPMPTIKIDNVEYDLDSLSQDAKAQLQSIQFVDQELARLQAQTAALQTARNAYVSALKAALPVLGGGDTLKLS